MIVPLSGCLRSCPVIYINALVLFILEKIMEAVFGKSLATSGPSADPVQISRDFHVAAAGCLHFICLDDPFSFDGI